MARFGRRVAVTFAGTAYIEIIERRSCRLTTPFPSPCNGTCTLDPATGWCLGCYRTGSEIMSWPTATEAQRRAVLAVLDERRDG